MGHPIESLKGASKPAPVVETLAETLGRDDSLELESAFLEQGEAVITLRVGGERAVLRLLPLCDRPRYADTKYFTAYYQGSGELSDRSRFLLDRAISTLRRIEDGTGDVPVKWPPALPKRGGSAKGAETGKGEGRPDGNGPVVVNRWRHVTTGAESLEVTLRVWNRCNQRCGFCQVEGQHWDLSHRKIVQTIEKYGNRAGSVRLNLTGGEPTLNPRLNECISLALEHSYQAVVVQTNAVKYASKGSVDALPVSDRLIFFVSFHGFDEETYDAATGTRGQYSKALSGINNLLQAGHQVMLNVVLTSGNLSVFPSMVGRVSKLFPLNRQGMTLQLSAMGGFPLIKERMTLIPRLTDVYLATRKAIAAAREQGLTVRDFDTSGFCALPACILSPGHRRSMRAVMANIGDFLPKIDVSDEPVGKEGSPFIKARACVACRYTKSCPGVLREYGILYGLRELKPIKSKQREVRRPNDNRPR